MPDTNTVPLTLRQSGIIHNSKALHVANAERPPIILRAPLDFFEIRATNTAGHGKEFLQVKMTHASRQIQLDSSQPLYAICGRAVTGGSAIDRTAVAMGVLKGVDATGPLASLMATAGVGATLATGGAALAGAVIVGGVVATAEYKKSRDSRNKSKEYFVRFAQSPFASDGEKIYGVFEVQTAGSGVTTFSNIFTDEMMASFG